MFTKKRWHTLVYLLFAGALLLAIVGAVPLTRTPKVQGYLQTLAAQNPEERVTVIIQKRDQSESISSPFFT